MNEISQWISQNHNEFSTADAEQQKKLHLAVRASAGLTFHAELRCLDVLGSERQKLLHGLLANEINALKPGQGNFSHLLDPKGKVQADMRVLAMADRIRIICTQALLEKIKKNIAMRIFRADVQLKEEKLAAFGICGPRSLEVLKIKLPAITSLGAEYEHATTSIASAEALFVRDHESGDVGFLCLAPEAAAKNVWQELSAIEGINIFGPRVFESLSMEAGVPRFSIDYNEENLSLEVNLNKAVSNSKGCYLGQEPVARILSRGHVAKRLVGLVIDDETALPVTATEIFADQNPSPETRPIGEITRAIYSPSLKKKIAFAFLKFQFLEDNENARVFLRASGASTISGHAQWQNLPFYRESGINWLAGGPQMQRVVAPNPRTVR